MLLLEFGSIVGPETVAVAVRLRRNGNVTVKVLLIGLPFVLVKLQLTETPTNEQPAGGTSRFEVERFITRVAVGLVAEVLLVTVAVNVA